MKRKIEDSKTRLQRHKSMEMVQLLDKIKNDFAKPLKSMQYFYDLYEKVYIKHEVIHDKTKPKIGALCIQVPYEIIYALDSIPVRLCNGFYTDEQNGSEFMPAKSCSLVKATLGMLENKDYPAVDKLDMIIHPTTCDQKTKTISTIEDMDYDIYHMEFPRVKESEESRYYWQRSVRSFAKHMQKELNTKLTRKKLKEAIKKVGLAQVAYHKLNELRKITPAPMTGIEMFLITNAFFFDDITSWSNAVEEVYKEVKNRVDNKINAVGKRSPRILYTGSPPIFPNLKLPLMIEEADGVIVADESCSSNRLLNDMVSVDEWFLYDMVDSLANRYLKGCTCPIFTRNDDRLRRIKTLIEDFNVDGVVYQSFAGCQVYELEHRSVGEYLEKLGIPMLYVEADYSPAQGGQISTRVEAFIESLKNRKRKKKV